MESSTAKLPTRDENYAHAIVKELATEPLNVVAPNMLPTAQHSQSFAPEVNMADGMQQDWRELCVAVTNESDSTRLTSLVQELIEALDRGERSWRHVIPPSDAIATNRESA